MRRPRPCTILVSDGWVVSSSSLLVSVDGRLRRAAAGRTWQAIAQAKAAISRAIAAVTRFAFLPAATRRR